MDAMSNLLNIRKNLLGTPDNLKLFTGDVTNQIVCKAIMEKAVNEFGGLDILVTNSADPVTGKFESLNTDQWDDAILKCLKSHILPEWQIQRKSGRQQLSWFQPLPHILPV